MKPYSFPDMSGWDDVSEEKKTSAETVFTRIFHDENGDVSENYVPVGRVSDNAGTLEKDQEEQAFIKGFEKGEQEGLASAKSRVETLIMSLNQAISNIDKAKEELFLAFEREAVELALSIAGKIVQHEVSTDRGVVLNVVKESLKKVNDHEKIKIRLNPADLDFMNEVVSQSPELLERFDEAVFESDTSIGNGGCVIDTSFGDIDARIKRQISIIEEMFSAQIRKQRIRE